MMIIRPIQLSDFDALHAIAQESGIGFTSLPVNETLLKQKIATSLRSFSTNAKRPADESYLFVMEDSTSGEVVGTTGIEATVGYDDANYHYHVSKVVHASRELKIHNTAEILTFCNDYAGVSEICTLFLRESARSGANGRFLSKVRFLFMIEHPHLFSETIIAEMRGVSDDNGRSPFWEWLERHFFSMDFPTVDYLTGIGNKVFIAELMPKYPIYVSLLSKGAQAAIGKVHEKTRPALRLLEEEGFKYRGYVDIFDGGPTVEADLSQIVTAKNSTKAVIEINDALAEQDGIDSFVINTSIHNFRATQTKIAYVTTSKFAFITASAASALNVANGDSIRFSSALKIKR